MQEELKKRRRFGIGPGVPQRLRSDTDERLRLLVRPRSVPFRRARFVGFFFFFFFSLTPSPPLLNLRNNPSQIYDPQRKKVSGLLSLSFILQKNEFFFTWLLLRAVHGVEFAFGAHEYPSTGIFEGEPKRCEGFSFRKTILIGKTDMGPGEVKTVMEELAAEYRGNAYNLITKNCNHFCNDACLRLTGNPIPSWVNRLARIGK